MESPKQPRKIELYTKEFYSTCTLGGIIACGPTHSSITPLDLVKCRLQVNPKLYTSNLDGFRKIVATAVSYTHLDVYKRQVKGLLPETSISYGQRRGQELHSV